MKKIIAITLVVMMVAVSLVGCVGKNKVTIDIDINGEVKQHSFSTNDETLEDLIVAKQEKLGATLQDSDYGKFVTGMNNYEAKSTDNEYFEFLIDGESASAGIRDTKIEDGKTYTFKLSSFETE